MAKRVFDLVFSLTGSLLLLPLLVVIAVVIKIDSKGPIFFRGVRSGLQGVPFRIFKFCTMIPDAESVGGPSTGRDDPRVTRVGGFLRRYKLDELPQLLNVIKGEMSLVGPRPEVPEYTRLYRGEERLILSVRPGITDYSSLRFVHLGEVLGNEDPDRVYEQEVRPIKNALRLKYVKDHTLWGDLKLILRTLAHVVRE